MLAFNHLGNLGRLGNQMFEFAALCGIAKKHGYEFCIPPRNYKGIENYSLHECFNLDDITEAFLETQNFMQERSFHFDEELFESCPDNVSLLGFFQSEKYFKHVEDFIREKFTFKNEYLEPCLELISNFEGQEPIMLHVRRGDPSLVDPRGFEWSYTKCSDSHPPQTLSYYKKALSHFDKNQPVIIFSDSPEWVKKQKLFSEDRFHISEPQEKYSDGSYTPYLDLCLMSLCSHAIIANSSLSWWGSWLQKNYNKKIIAPKKWFGPAKINHDTKNLYVEDWIVL